MQAIAAHAARGLDVRYGTRVVAATVHDGVWTARTDRGSALSADALVLTPPVPRCLPLLERVALPGRARDDLAAIGYAPTLAVLARLAGPSQLPDPGAWHGDGEPVAWLADNRKKGISQADTLTIHAGEALSANLTDEVEAVSLLVEAAAPVVGVAASGWRTHRWAYATPVEPYPQPTLAVDNPAPLAFAGDAFAGPRVEGAALSGLSAAGAILERVS